MSEPDWQTEMRIMNASGSYGEATAKKLDQHPLDSWQIMVRAGHGDPGGEAVIPGDDMIELAKIVLTKVCGIDPDVLDDAIFEMKKSTCRACPTEQPCGSCTKDQDCECYEHGNVYVEDGDG